MQEAGADALELNVFHTPLNPLTSSVEIERETVALVHEVKGSLGIPVAVKLWPFYNAFAHFALQLDREGADGLVLFNRFYEVDIDVQQLEITRTLHLSTSAELPLRLRGIAAPPWSGRRLPSLAACTPPSM
jgi:dihydroorotate dehydrogenase (fumarate)